MPETAEGMDCSIRLEKQGATFLLVDDLTNEFQSISALLRRTPCDPFREGDVEGFLRGSNLRRYSS